MNIVVLLCFCFTVKISKALGPRTIAPLDFGGHEDAGDEIDEEITTVSVPDTTPLDDATRLRKYYLECIAQTHVPTRLVRRFRTGHWDHNIFIKRWALCVLNKLGLMSLQGVFQYDTAMSKIRSEDENFADKIIDQCLNDKPNPPIEIAWQYLKCHSEKDRKHFLPSLGIRLDKYNK